MSRLLQHNDMRFVAQHLPKDVRDLLSRHSPSLFVAGGFVRAVVAGETPVDIDIFGDDADRLRVIANDLCARRPGSRLHTTGNAITLLTPNRMPVQFITRWTFPDATRLVKSFDFTVCAAAVWRNGPKSNDPWMSEVSDRFYPDLAGRRLVYTNPVRDEEAGGSLLRVLKYLRRGYSIQVASLAAVTARLMLAVDAERADNAHLSLNEVLAGLLRDVDPLLVVDGFDVVDDHAEVPTEAAS